MAELYRMDPLEVAGGWVYGYDTDPMPPGPHDPPRRALDRILLPHLLRSPCMIAFSGGRDSSALLAAAVALARREGLPLPTAVTLTYPGVAETAESDWQQQVLDHLGVHDHVEITVHDEHDPLGPVATPVLRRHGLLWPPGFTATCRMLHLARGGSLLTGESGDEVFGVKRITPLTRTLAAHGRAHRSLYLPAARALAPTPLRRRWALRNRYLRTWLREPVEKLLARRVAEDHAVASLHAGRHAWQYASRRAVRRGYETFVGLGSELDVDYAAPFGEPAFVAAFAQAAGFWGWTGRTATMMRLFGDLLPREVLHRMSKADFTLAVFTEHTRAFARQWDGSGVSAELVDPEALRESWLSERPAPATMGLLQQAWLADQPVTHRVT